MNGEKGSLACNLPNTGVVAPSGGSGIGMVTSAPELEIDDNKVKRELVNSGQQNIFIFD